MAPRVLSSKVELHIQCVGLKKLDFISKSDPFVVVYVKKDPQNVNSGWKEHFRTKTLDNEHNPIWSDQILADYQFEAMQEIKFDVYDRDSKSEKLSAHDFLGSFETSMSAIMGSVGCTISGLLMVPKKTKPYGKIIINGQEVNACNDLVTFRFQATKVEKKNMMGFGKSDPFYEISQSMGDGKFLKVFTSEIKKNNLNPTWKPQCLPVQMLTNGAMDREIRIDVFDWESNGKHKFIGSFKTTLEEMKTKKSFSLLNGTVKKKDKSRGTFLINTFTIEERPTFLEYIQGGLEMNLSIAIDFTGSNGHPKDRSSLHFMPEGFAFTNGVANINQYNQYQKATWSVGRILQDYDEDKNIPVYGFGGYFNEDTHHCFALNFNEANPEVHRIEGVMEAYKTALLSVELSGPTYFKDVLTKAVGEAEEISSSRAKQKYNVLLILTDGCINDMEKSISAIIEGSSLPLSIIIVGVGKADFTNMETLDGDGVLLKLGSKVAKRDIVQFVPFSEFAAKGPTSLAEEVLREVPGQVVDYFHKLKKMAPQPPQEASKSHFIDDVPVAEVVEPNAKA